MKKKLMHHIIEQLNVRIKSLADEMEEMQSSAANDAKSSAGDKHETAAAMMHIELERLSKSIHETRQHAAAILAIEETPIDTIRQGALIQTDRGYFLMATAMGKIKTEDAEVFVISSASPMGKLMLGKKAGETIQLNGMSYSILNVE